MIIAAAAGGKRIATRMRRMSEGERARKKEGRKVVSFFGIYSVDPHVSLSLESRRRHTRRLHGGEE